MRKAIAIDFDGCICTDAFPAIGEPNWAVINKAKAEKQAGAGLILWTCREDDLLQEAVTACKSWGLTFDAINESLPDWIKAFGTRPRKVGASEYWDDKAVRQPDRPPLNDPLTLDEIRQMRGKPVWCPEAEAYGIITMDKIGAWANKPFLKFFWLPDEDASCGVNCEWSIEERGLTLYRCKPEVCDAVSIDALRALATATNSLRYNPEIDTDIAAAYERSLVNLRDELCQECAQEPNPPLALDELQEMDGKPVWIECMEPYMGHLSCWGIRNSGFIEGYKTDYYDSGYGKTWLAYRRKPEETNNERND